MDVDSSLRQTHDAALSLCLDWAEHSENGHSNLQSHGDWQRWRAGLEQLPPILSPKLHLNGKLSVSGAPNDTRALEEGLLALHPWRKGPIHVQGIHIDTEWRSDWKWTRVRKHLGSLEGHRILDVGCGNGYYMFRMLGAGASEVVGVDPTVVFLAQYLALRHLFSAIVQPHAILATRFEELSASLRPFDTVFSMGVLYHRPEPSEHFQRLRQQLRPGGTLVLETLVVSDDQGPVLVPGGRYARMRNVHSIPTVGRLESWALEAGFSDPRVVDVTATTCEEQRPTRWMHFESLEHALDPKDPTKTIEGHPAPLRAVMLATHDGR